MPSLSCLPAAHLRYCMPSPSRYCLPSAHLLYCLTHMQGLGLDWEERVLPSIGNEVVKSVVAQYNAEQLLTQRDKVRVTSRQQCQRPPTPATAAGAVHAPSPVQQYMCAAPLCSKVTLQPLHGHQQQQEQQLHWHQFHG